MKRIIADNIVLNVYHELEIKGTSLIILTTKSTRLLISQGELVSKTDDEATCPTLRNHLEAIHLLKFSIRNLTIHNYKDYLNTIIASVCSSYGLSSLQATNYMFEQITLSPDLTPSIRARLLEHLHTLEKIYLPFPTTKQTLGGSHVQEA